MRPSTSWSWIDIANAFRMLLSNVYYIWLLSNLVWSTAENVRHNGGKNPHEENVLQFISWSSVKIATHFAQRPLHDKRGGKKSVTRANDEFQRVINFKSDKLVAMNKKRYRVYKKAVNLEQCLIKKSVQFALFRNCSCILAAYLFCASAFIPQSKTYYILFFYKITIHKCTHRKIRKFSCEIQWTKSKVFTWNVHFGRWSVNVWFYFASRR